MGEYTNSQCHTPSWRPENTYKLINTYQFPAIQLTPYQFLLISSTPILPQIATDCNENIRRAENEVKLFTITKRFPNDEVEVVSARWVTKNGEC